MNIDQILGGLQDIDTLKALMQQAKADLPTEKAKQQLDPQQHAVVTDKVKRPDKNVVKDGDADGNAADIVFVSRLPIPLQKVIVNSAAAFLCGNPIELIEPDDAEDLMGVLRRAWDSNKMDYKIKGILKRKLSECEVALLWYTEKAPEGYWAGTKYESGVANRLRLRILSPVLGDTLVPTFSDTGDLIAFGRGYTTGSGDSEMEHYDIYTAATTYYNEKKKGGSWEPKQEANPSGEIPVIYDSQPRPEWDDVQPLIDRLETLISNLADTNDYFGSPMVLVEGDVKGFATKGEQGKVLQLEPGAKVEYMTWTQPPESVKLEYTNLRSLIMDMTYTPDLSFEQAKGLGNYSGVALKMLFLGAHMKAADHEEGFGETIQRCVNFMINALVKMGGTKLTAQQHAQVKPRFTYFLPKNELETVQVLTTALMGERPIMSQETAVKRLQDALGGDGQGEWDKIEEEQRKANTAPGGLDRVIKMAS